MPWIKIDHATPDKPEIHALAELLAIDPDAVLGKLVRLWIWADQQTYDGCNAASVTEALLDRVTLQRGMAAALMSDRVNWLTRMADGNIQFPNFARHNGPTAKHRASTTRRVANHRAACNAAVTHRALQDRYQIREEERRNKNTPPPPPAGGASAHVRGTCSGQAAEVARRYLAKLTEALGVKFGEPDAVRWGQWIDRVQGDHGAPIGQILDALLWTAEHRGEAGVPEIAEPADVARKWTKLVAAIDRAGYRWEPDKEEGK
jgi:hypothetical protein